MIKEFELAQEMEMPIPCQSCGKWFDLNDGCISDKWYPDTVICKECSYIEEQEVELDQEEQGLIYEIADAEFTIKESKEGMEKIRVKKDELQIHLENHRKNVN